MVVLEVVLLLLRHSLSYNLMVGESINSPESIHVLR